MRQLDGREDFQANKDVRKIKTEYPSARIYGHRDFDKKDCPCFNAKLEYGRI